MTKLDTNEIDICEGESVIDYSENAGIILKSPGYPNYKYLEYADCQKVIHFSKETPYRIEFLGDFALESNPDGSRCFDFIEIKNGADSDAPLIIKACGEHKPQAINAKGNSVWISFESDDTQNEKGFRMKITKVDQSECKNLLFFVNKSKSFKQYRNKYRTMIAS